MVLSGKVSNEPCIFPLPGLFVPTLHDWKNPADPNLAIPAVNAMANFADRISLLR
jgi:hypothetical protein